jgi:hypothetical protein
MKEPYFLRVATGHKMIVPDNNLLIAFVKITFRLRQKGDTPPQVETEALAELRA